MMLWSDILVLTDFPGFSNESSDDEPLINLVHKKCTETQMKAAKKRDATRQTQASGKDTRITYVRFFHVRCVALHITTD